MGGVTLGDLIGGAEQRLGLAALTDTFPWKREIRRAEIQHYGGRNLPFKPVPGAIAVMAPEFVAGITKSPRRRSRKLLRDIAESNPSCIFLSRNQYPPEFLRNLLRNMGIAAFTSSCDEHLLGSRLLGLIKERLRQITTLHGVLINKAGQGIAITGESGSGKTSCALKMMERGYRWVADDVIRLERKHPDLLYGRGHGLTGRCLEIKERGIVDVRLVIAPQSLCEETLIDLFVHLGESSGGEKGDKGACMLEGSIEILGVRLPRYTIFNSFSIEEMASHIDFIVCGLGKKGGRP
jgi:HPr kinase/phosphorylase